MPAREDAPGLPRRPVAAAIWAAFASFAAVDPALAQAFDPASPQVLQAYSPPLDGDKLSAARAGLNNLLPKLVAFSSLLLTPVGGSSGFNYSAEYYAFTTTIGGGFGFGTSYSELHYAGSDADLAILGNPVLLSDAILQATANFATARDFVIGPVPALIETPGTELTITGNITANAMLTKAGSGTLLLTGTNAWAVAPQVEEGTLKGPASSLQTDIANDGSVEFAQASDGAYGFVMQGEGGLRKSGPGTLILSGQNDYAGATSIDEGRLAVSGAGRLGAGAVAIAAGATLDLSSASGDRGIGALTGSGAVVLGSDRLDTLTETNSLFGGVISGAGSFGKGGAGKLTLTGASTYAGATVVTAGTLALAGAGRLNASSPLRMNAAAVFDISAADGARAVGSIDGGGTIVLGANALTAGEDNTDTVFGGSLQGTGAFTKIGSGTLTLTGETQHTGTTTIAQGTLLVRAQSLGPSVVNNATLTFAEIRTAASGEPPVPAGTLYASYPELFVYSGDITGTGQVLKLGSGALWLRGSNAYSGGTRIDDGILVGNDRSLQGAIVNNSGIAFYQAADGVYSGSTSGTGILLKYGPGNLTLSGINSHAGGTAFSGPLTISDDRNLGAPGAAVIVAGGTLRTTASIAMARPFGVGAEGVTFDTGSHAVALTGPIVGAGGLTKVGSGLLTLAGANSYGGATRVQAGTLAIAGTLASAVTVAPGARLTGTGSVGAQVTLAPDATLGVRVDADGNASRITASSAQIEGSRLDIEALPGAYRSRTSYTILATATGSSGRFRQVGIDAPFLEPELAYGAHDVVLTLTRNDSSYRTVAQTPAQAGIAMALGSLTRLDDSDARLVGETLDGLSTAGARAAFDSIGGTGRAQVALVQQSGQRAVTQQAMSRLALTDAGGNGAGSPLASGGAKLAFDEAAVSDARAMYAAALAGASAEAPAAVQRHGFWLRGFGGTGRIDGPEGAGDAKFRFAGIVAGYDQSLSERVRLGALAAYSKPRLNQDDPDTSSEAESVELALYGRYRHGPLRVDFLVGGAASDIDGRRVVTAGGLTRVASSAYSARSASAYVEAGYALGHTVVVEPTASLEWSRQRNRSYTERGAGAFNLTEPARTIDSLRVSLGARVLRTWESADMRTTLEARAAWAHEFRSQPSISARFAADPAGAAFSVPAVDLPPNSAVLGAGITVSADRALSFYADLSSELSSGRRVHELGVGLRYHW